MSDYSQLTLVDKQLQIKKEPEDEIDIKLETEVGIRDMECKEEKNVKVEKDLEIQDFGNDKIKQAEDEINIKLETEVFISDMEFEEDDDKDSDFGDYKNVEIRNEASNIKIEEEIPELCSTILRNVRKNQLYNSFSSIRPKSKYDRTKEGVELYTKLIKKNEFSYTCKMCFFKHETLNMIRKHCKQHIHFDQNDKCSYIICHLCNKRYKLIFHFYRHVNSSHTREKTFSCDKCQKKFTRKDSLRNHYIFVHMCRKRNKIALCAEDEMKDDYICSICNHTFRRQHSLQRHMVEAHKGVKHTCDLCNRQFTQKASVIKHLNAIHYKNKVTCNSCGQSFSVKGSLRRHIERKHKK